MEHSLLISGKEVRYTLRESTRTKRVRLTVYPGGSFVVTVPERTPIGFIEKVLSRRVDWILTKMAQLAGLPMPPPRPSKAAQKAHYVQHKKSAQELAVRRVAYLNEHYGFTYKQITIRNQKTRWGSCSKKGNLSFNYKIALMPEYLADYIIIHELCHLGAFDHSTKFWNLVAETVPNYKALRRELRQRANFS